MGYSGKLIYILLSTVAYTVTYYVKPQLQCHLHGDTLKAEYLSAEHSAADQRTQVRGSPGETPPCTLMAPDAYKFCRRCYIHEV